MGVIMFGRRYRQALTTLLLVTIAGFAFSFLGGFSIGRFTALLPCWRQVAAYVAAILIYLLFAWMIPEQVHYWGIQFELPICLLAYAVALRFPPRQATRSSRYRG